MPRLINKPPLLHGGRSVCAFALHYVHALYHTAYENSLLWEMEGLDWFCLLDLTRIISSPGVEIPHPGGLNRMFPRIQPSSIQEGLISLPVQEGRAGSCLAS